MKRTAAAISLFSCLFVTSCSGVAPDDAGVDSDAGGDGGSRPDCEPVGNEATYSLLSLLLHQHAGAELAILREDTTTIGEPTEDDLANLDSTFRLSGEVVACAIETDSSKHLEPGAFDPGLELLLMDSATFDAFAETMGPFDPNTDNVFSVSLPVSFADGERAFMTYADYRTPGFDVAKRVVLFEHVESKWELEVVDFVSF